MAADCLEANSMHQTPSVDGGEVNTNPLISIDENLSNIKVSKPKRVHQFYFVKMRPYNDPVEASKIAEAEKRIEKLTSDLLEVEKRLTILMGQLEWTDGSLQPVELQRRRGGIICWMEREKIVMDQLHIDLNKLNILCQERGADHKSTLSVERRSHPRQGFKCRMRMPHGISNNLVTERKLLRQITTSQEINKEYGLTPEIGWCIRGGKPMLEKIKQIEQRKEKALADAIATGDIWDPFTAKRAIQEQIKLLNKQLGESREELCEVNVELKREMKSIKTIEKDLIEQRRKLRSQKLAAQQWISERRSQLMNNKYEENMMVYMNNARELARRKDVESLRKLRRRQMKRFMLEWNQNKEFRLGYEVTILKSLEERGLSRDGRIKG